jgi:hypothetical protein
MMNILKKDQYLPMSLQGTIDQFKKTGWNVKIRVELHKMVEVSMGRIEKRLVFLEIKNDELTSYMVFWHGMNKVVGMGDSLKELVKHYTEKGYKTDKKFYTEELGMSEETWNEWNGIGTEEE